MGDVANTATTASASTELFIGGFFMSAETIPISSHQGFKSQKSRRSRQRVFDLGSHSYMGAPGCSWSTNYWVKRITANEWELYASQEGSLSKRECAGLFTVEELRDYFDSVSFWLDEDRWATIGLAHKAVVIGLDGTLQKQYE